MYKFETHDLLLSDPLDVPLYPFPDPEDFTNTDLYHCGMLFRHDDLKQMLDSNRDNMKLEAMKRIIGVCSNCNEFFNFILEMNLSQLLICLDAL